MPFFARLETAPRGGHLGIIEATQVMGRQHPQITGNACCWKSAGHVAAITVTADTGLVLTAIPEWLALVG